MFAVSLYLWLSCEGWYFVSFTDEETNSDEKISQPKQLESGGQQSVFTQNAVCLLKCSLLPIEGSEGWGRHSCPVVFSSWVFLAFVSSSASISCSLQPPLNACPFTAAHLCPGVKLLCFCRGFPLQHCVIPSQLQVQFGSHLCQDSFPNSSCSLPCVVKAPYFYC